MVAYNNKIYIPFCRKKSRSYGNYIVIVDKKIKA